MQHDPRGPSMDTYASDVATTNSSSISTIRGTGSLAAVGLEAVGKRLLKALDIVVMARKLSIAKSVIPHTESASSRSPRSLRKLEKMYDDLFEMVIRHRQYLRCFSIQAHELLIVQMRHKESAHSDILLKALSNWPRQDILTFLQRWPDDCSKAVYFDDMDQTVKLRWTEHKIPATSGVEPVKSPPTTSNTRVDSKLHYLTLPAASGQTQVDSETSRRVLNHETTDVWNGVGSTSTGQWNMELAEVVGRVRELRTGESG